MIEPSSFSDTPTTKKGVHYDKRHWKLPQRNAPRHLSEQEVPVSTTSNPSPSGGALWLSPGKIWEQVRSRRHKCVLDVKVVTRQLVQRAVWRFVSQMLIVWGRRPTLLICEEHLTKLSPSKKQSNNSGKRPYETESNGNSRVRGHFFN